jgi:superoxide dismutase
MKQEDILLEKKEKLELPKLKFAKTDLEPVLSEENVIFHYDTLTKAYFEKYNKTGDEFQYAGAFLHAIWWEQFTSKFNWAVQPKMKEFLKTHFKSIEDFKEQITKAATELHGSGWVYLSKSGKIKTIKNHEIKKDILILIDVWEHSFQHDYGSDKEKYIKNLWKIMDWMTIETRLNIS